MCMCVCLYVLRARVCVYHSVYVIDFELLFDILIIGLYQIVFLEVQSSITSIDGPLFNSSEHDKCSKTRDM